MKKKETKIATNVSSGAEKVEAVEKEVKKSQNAGTKTAETKKVKSTVAKGDAALGDSAKSTPVIKEEKISAKKVNAQSSGSKAEKESAAAKARVEEAMKKKEEKEKRKEERAKKKAEKQEARKKKIAERKAAIEKRLAQKKADAAKHAAERKALAEKRAAEKEAAVRERAHAKANKKQANSRKKSEKNRRKKNDKERESRAKGYGGWIAAVVTLGVTTLALGTTVTVGALEMMKTKDGMMAANQGTMYELNGIIGNMDGDLDRIRISATPQQQSRILTDLLVQARLAEADLEKLPISAEEDQNVSVYFNRTAAVCERMLSKLRNGGTLSSEDIEILEGLYKTNHSIRAQLEEMTSNMTDKDLMSYMKKGQGMIADALHKLEETTLEENRLGFERAKEKMEGAGMQRNAPIDPSKEPAERIESVRAEELCRTYFKDYDIEEYQCVGETVSRSFSAYNVQGYDKNGTMLFAEINQKDGALLRFDYYEECSAENFNLDNAERIAEEFLQNLGYQDMTAVRVSSDGSTTDFTFAYETDGVVYYPDEVRVKVCRTRGVVTGLDASKYLKNHRSRDEVNAKISLETAYGKLNDKLTVETSRLTVVDTKRGERAAYEFLCSYDNSNYFVYLDAETGAEISIINVGSIE